MAYQKSHGDSILPSCLVLYLASDTSVLKEQLWDIKNPDQVVQEGFSTNHLKKQLQSQTLLKALLGGRRARRDRCFANILNCNHQQKLLQLKTSSPHWSLIERWSCPHISNGGLIHRHQVIGQSCTVGISWPSLGFRGIDKLTFD